MKQIYSPVFFLYLTISNIFSNGLFYLYIITKKESKSTFLFCQYIFPSVIYYCSKTVFIFNSVRLSKNIPLLILFAIFNFLFSYNFDRLLHHKSFILIIIFNNLFVGATDGYMMRSLKTYNSVQKPSYLKILLYRYLSGLPINIIAIIFNILDKKNKFFFILIFISFLFSLNILFIIINRNNLNEQPIYEEKIIDFNILPAYIISSITEVIVYSVLYINYNKNPFLLYYFSFDYFLKLFTMKINRYFKLIFSFCKILFCSITVFLLIYQELINKYLLLSICLVNGITHQLLINTFQYDIKLRNVIELLIFTPLIIFAYSLFNKIDYKGLLYYSPVRM